jgi:hypothetical protein
VMRWSEGFFEITVIYRKRLGGGGGHVGVVLVSF